MCDRERDRESERERERECNHSFGYEDDLVSTCTWGTHGGSCVLLPDCSVKWHVMIEKEKEDKC